MDFVDSFTDLKEIPQAPLVRRYFETLNAFLDNQSDEFLELWHPGPESVLYFNLDERERGGEAVRQTFRQVRSILSRVPIGTTIEGSQIAYFEDQSLAYAVLMERAVSESDQQTVVSEHRTTLVWRRFDGEWKMVHMHSDTYNRRMELLSELLRATATL